MVVIHTTQVYPYVIINASRSLSKANTRNAINKLLKNYQNYYP